MILRYILYMPVMVFPFLAYILSSSRKRDLIYQDATAAYAVCFPGSVHSKAIMLVRLLADTKEFRNIFYKRLSGVFCFISRYVLPPLNTFRIMCSDIGGGFFVEHATSTYINATTIGYNFSAKQNVTVGWNNGKPNIGDNVFIGAGAVVLGPITIGNNVRIGANATVVDDVPDNAVVVSPKAKVVKILSPKNEEVQLGGVIYWYVGTYLREKLCRVFSKNGIILFKRA